MSHDGKRPVTLEDLLRLKRAERPVPEFWEQFDRELRAKQLAALVQRRPWWRDLPQFLRVRRYHLPLGAAAAVAITFISVREYHSVSVVAASGVGRTPAVAAVPAAPVPATTMAETDTQAVTTAASSELDLAAPLSVATASVPADSETSSVAGSAPVIPLLAGTLEASPATAETSPSARSIAANLAAAETIGNRVLLGKTATFEVRPMVARSATVEPLQQMTSPLEVRLARYRSPLVASVSTEAPDRTGERIARRISDDRLYDQISRIGARGDRVQVRF